MGIAYIEGGGGGGVRSSDVTALKANILAGTYDIAADSNDDVVEGAMPNRGAVSKTLAVNETYTIPAGYHDGNGTVTQNIPVLGATNYGATTSDQVIAGGQYLSGAQVIKGLSQSGLASSNILRGVTVNINNGFGNVWSVGGASNVLKYISGAADLTAYYDMVTVVGYGTMRAYYVDIAPGFTPVFALSVTPQMYVWLTGATAGHMICEAAGGVSTQGQLAGNWKFSATGVRLYGYPATGVPNPNTFRYWIFGY